MFTKEQIEKIVRKKIESEETLGQVSGGSDHIGHITYSLDKFSKADKVEKGWKITYEYSTEVVTEFTIWPDNPPYVYEYKKRIVINEKGDIIEESDKKTRLTQGGKDVIPDF